VLFLLRPNCWTRFVHPVAIVPHQKEGRCRKLTPSLPCLRGMKVVLVGKYLSPSFKTFLLLAVQFGEEWSLLLPLQWGMDHGCRGSGLGWKLHLGTVIISTLCVLLRRGSIADQAVRIVIGKQGGTRFSLENRHSMFNPTWSAITNTGWMRKASSSSGRRYTWYVLVPSMARA
jgi:hypothetical protein